VARQIGYVPQHHPDIRLTVFEAVLLGRKPHIRWTVTDDDYAQAEKAIQQIGIAHLTIRPLSDLSRGEVQKVLIARALAQSPEILLLDEPTSNLDLKSQLEVIELIRRIVETQGLSAVVSIHDLNIALRFADSLLFLKDRRVHAVSTRENLTAEMIRQVYGVDVKLLTVGDHIMVAPL
jgi:iron complex transport system ATP-binding protein